MWALAWVLVAALAALGEARQPPRPHPAVVQALAPKGLRVSLPDQPGMDLVVINANVNLPLEPKEPGQVSATVAKSDGGFWTLYAPELQLKKGDVVFYWAYVSVNEQGRNVAGRQLIAGLVEPSCAPSVTTVNKQPACGGTLVFEDNFDTLNTSTWMHHIQFSNDPDREFCTYVADGALSFARDGALHLKASVVDDVDALSEASKIEGCTWKRPEGDYCERQPMSWDILPPARSAWLSTDGAFTFAYGRVEVRAKAAAGDWLVSFMYLEPHENAYGPYPYDSGRAELGRVRGNARYAPSEDDDDAGARRVDVRSAIAACYLVYFDPGHSVLHQGLFSDDFHLFGLTWTPQELRFEVDGRPVKTIRPPPGGRLHTDQYRHCEGSQWEKGTAAAPFDKEFSVNLALQVGGFHAFRDCSKSGNVSKPWNDRSPRAPLNFWKARNTFLPTWKSDFEIDYVKVWAL